MAPAISPPARRNAAATRSPPWLGAFNHMARDSVRSRRRAGRLGSRPPPAARRRVARADDAGDRDARLPRNAGDARADAGRSDATPVSEDHRRRDRPARSADWRPPRISPASKAEAATLRISTSVRSPSCSTRVSARHERACQEAGITLEASIAPGAETVTGDQDRLEQALQNLAANAIRYAPRGTAVRLSARCSPADFRVPTSEPRLAEARKPGASEGGGRKSSFRSRTKARALPPEHLPHIFDRFYKADAASAGVSGGSGLGLSMSKAIVERQGGRLTVASRPGPYGLRDDPAQAVDGRLRRTLGGGLVRLLGFPTPRRGSARADRPPARADGR